MENVEKRNACHVSGCSEYATIGFLSCERHRGMSALAATVPPKVDGLPPHTICPVEGCNVGVLVGNGVYCRTHRHLEANGTNAPPAQPLAPEQPVIRYGNVLMTLGQEINIAAQQLAALKRFEQRVIEAAKSPAAWLALREELGK